MFELRRRVPGGRGAIALTLFLVVMLIQVSCSKDEDPADTGATDLAATDEPATTEPLGTDTATSEPLGTDITAPAAGRDIQVIGTSQLKWKLTIDGVPQAGTSIPVKVGDKVTWTTGGGPHGVSFLVCDEAKAIMTFSPELDPQDGTRCGTEGAPVGPFTVGTVTAVPTSTVNFDCTVHGEDMNGSIVAAP